MLIDARGKACPLPVTLAAAALAAISEGVVEVLVDNHEAAINLRDYAGENGTAMVQTREDKDWKVKIVKGNTP